MSLNEQLDRIKAQHRAAILARIDAMLAEHAPCHYNATFDIVDPIPETDDQRYEALLELAASIVGHLINVTQVGQ